jgi:UDP-N-acetylglucosamine--N-acetylmuramyl-(pentapeptide) pyrophosphoryl-undecaprenol N-acetylglucosamine transferase
MSQAATTRVAIACGGTGGHLFPGLAVAEQLVDRGCSVTLLVSPKEVDQQAVRLAKGVEVVTLPAVGLSQGKRLAFMRGFVQSYRSARKIFRASPPDAALAMGGFTSAPPVLAARGFGARTFLHESNTIPGRANRWLSRVVHQAFVGFPQAAAPLHTRNVTCTGTPVRPQFQSRDAAPCRIALGLDPDKPVLLVTGGSQGASGLNHLVIQTLPLFARAVPELQLFLLTGSNDFESVRQSCSSSPLKTLVHPFFAEMDLALGAATIAVSRAGASSLAELAAVRVPGVLVPFPAATDNHQFYNARAFEETGAARLLEQKSATPEKLFELVSEWMSNDAAREKARIALAGWHAPKAAGQIAETMLAEVRREKERLAKLRAGHGGCSCGHDHHARAESGFKAGNVA